VPDHPSWLERVPELLIKLQAETAPPLLDRAAIETLFGLRRRQAIALLHRFPGYQLGRTFVVPRESVIEFLARQPTCERLEQAEAQKQRVAEFLGEARQALTLPRISLPLPTKLSEITFAGLPPGIELTPGRLSIQFESATGLLEKLFALAQAFANDFESLEAALAAADPKGTARDSG
jgi:hypothetical protein